MAKASRRQRILLACSADSPLQQPLTLSALPKLPALDRPKNKSWLFGGWSGKEKTSLFGKDEDENKGVLGNISRFLRGDEASKIKRQDRSKSVNKDVAPPSGAAEAGGGNVSTTPFKTKQQSADKGPKPWQWKQWKKMTLDFYVKLRERPTDTRIKVKQTLALLPFLKVKPMIELGAPNFKRGTLTEARLDIKAFGCFKYRIWPSGESAIQVRAKAPLSDPRFIIDVVYTRNLSDNRDRVGVTLRGLDMILLKAPRFGAGFKIPVRFQGGVKSTLLAKKFLFQDPKVLEGQRRRRRTFLKSGKRPERKHRFQNLHIEGPTGLDIKIRCLEYD